MPSTDNFKTKNEVIKFESSFSFQRLEEVSRSLYLNNKEQLRLTWIPQKRVSMIPVFIKQQFMRIFKGRLFSIGG